MQIRILVLATAVLLFGAIMTVPRIVEASKSSAATANSTILQPQAVPNAPSNLTSRMTGQLIRLTWVDNSNNETGFSIERCEPIFNCPEFDEIGQTGSNATSFTDDGTPTFCYPYRIRAFNGAGYSAYSNTTVICVPRER